MRTKVILSLSTVLALSSAQDDNGCKGGTCPFPTSGGAGNSGGRSDDENGKCNLWMGPSPIKNAEEHGFGLGIFTGKQIKAGTPIESNFFGHGEVLLPIYASDAIYDNHPPLREYIWDEDNIPEVPVEYPDVMTALFIPGIAAIAPCTSKNYNLELAGRGTDYDKPRWSAASDDSGVHRSTHPQAGAFSYRHNITYFAVRDIAPGEELTIRCSDSNYDGGAYYLSRYDESDNSVVCLDKNMRVGRTSSEEAKGLGVFAKRNMKKDTIITSTPLVPLHRSELDVDDPDVNQHQLMLNYVFGHPDSDLLLLPIGPMVNFINHNNEKPNAVVRWHTVKEQHQQQGALERRQEYHHPELFLVPVDTVVKAHGRGLMMDIIALRDIGKDEEIFLDYGPDWQKAWEEHKNNFERFVKPQMLMNPDDLNYISAARYVANSKDDAVYRTDFEQGLDPYPENVKFHCFYQQHEDEFQKEDSEVEDAYRKELTASRGFRHFSFNDHPDHPCMRPCAIVERYQSDEDDEPRYSVEMFKQDNKHVMYYCSISMDYFYKDVPHSDIRLLDREYTTDVLMPHAFRHEIGVPNGFYPDTWMRKKLRNRWSSDFDYRDDFKKKLARKEVIAEYLAMVNAERAYSTDESADE